jgi:tRNA pseudouridine55 synthase
MKNQKRITMTQRKKTKKRDISGVFLLNKPLGLSSNQALQKVRWLYSAEKGGHTGSLDPLATGLLPICLGEATKFSQYLLAANKSYDFTVKLGQVTSTGDVEGEVVTERSVPELSHEAIQAVVERFTGDISQVPPMFSALKHEGQRLYKLAREGIEVERAARPVSIFSLKINKVHLPSIHFSVNCSKGTYVRSLAVDMGEALGCGAHVTRLHRTAVGSISGDRMLELADLEAIPVEGGFSERDALLEPIAGFLSQMPVQCLLADAARRIKTGQKIPVPPGLPVDVPLRVMSDSGAFLGIAELKGGLLVPKRLCR